MSLKIQLTFLNGFGRKIQVGSQLTLGHNTDYTNSSDIGTDLYEYFFFLLTFIITISHLF
jgi:hypothetical protein